MKTIVETERILLRQFVEEDYEAVYEFNSNVEVQRYTGDELIESKERAKELINMISLPEYEKHGYGRWAVVYKPENKVIGFAGLKYLSELDETDIGFRFLPEYWGMGIATEASKEIIRFGFDSLNLDRIIGIAMPENVGSNRVLVKIGLSLYKVGDYENDGGTYNWYRLNKEEYLENSKNP